MPAAKAAGCRTLLALKLLGFPALILGLEEALQLGDQQQADQGLSLHKNNNALRLLHNQPSRQRL